MPRRGHRSQALAVALLVCAGCTDGFGTKSGRGNTQQDADAPPADQSLPRDRYIQAGVPADDRVWSGTDMKIAARVLTRIAQTDPGHVPRYQSERSGKMFQRITSDENLRKFRDRSRPIEQRIPDALTYMESGNQILKLYLAAFSRRSVGDSEVVELVGAQMRISVVMTGLVNEFLPTLDKNDPSYPVRMQGMKRMQNGYAMMTRGFLQMLTESQAYRISERKRLAGYLKITLPGILPALRDADRSATLSRLRTLAADPNLQNLNPELATLLAAAEQAAERRRNR